MKWSKATLLPMRELVEAVAGGPVRGSWWAHPKGKAIFEEANRLADDPEVMVTKLVEGKVTFVPRKFWPAVYRVVTDRAWRRRAGKKHPMAEHAVQQHSPSGKHVMVRTKWQDWADAQTRRAAAKLSFDEALNALRAAAAGRRLSVE